jgi:uncharacterized protein
MENPEQEPQPVEAPSVAPPAEERPAPVGGQERISSIDVVRGVAVLGILAMNIVGFAFHMATYADPTVQGGATGANLWIYLFNGVMVDGKMRGIFSMLFGAGVVLMVGRMERRGAPGADVHYRRMLWLMLFGIVHAFTLWWGEILYPYALYGLILYPLRNASPKKLLIVSALLILGVTGFSTGFAFGVKDTREKGLAAEAALAKGATLTAEQRDQLDAWKKQRRELKPDSEDLKKTVDGFRGNYASVFKARAPIVMQWHSMPFWFPFSWDLVSMMLLGMALLKLGVFSAERSTAFYLRMAAVGYAIGIPLHIAGLNHILKNNFDMVELQMGFIPYQPARIAVCLAHVSVVMLICKAGLLQWLTRSLAAVGQMALTNYVMQSVICSTLFYGYGFGLFARLERHQVYYVVGSIWLFQMATSPIWLRYYRFGPLEWCWRSLTYWKRQPMRAREREQVGDTAAAVA